MSIDLIPLFLRSFYPDIEVDLVSAIITVGEGEVAARVCVRITDGTTAIVVTVFLTTENDSATGSYPH